MRLIMMKCLRRRNKVMTPVPILGNVLDVSRLSAAIGLLLNNVLGLLRARVLVLC